ncbi:MAG: LysE family transporter [Hydrogenibacillus sp.]|nr:LysE family transporter [Hydrogenibacillus sp.]
MLDTIGVIGPAALTHTGAARLAFTAGAMTSSLLWFFALALFGRTIRRLKAEWVRHVARLSAVFIWGAAAYLLYAFVRSITAA